MGLPIKQQKDCRPTVACPPALRIAHHPLTRWPQRLAGLLACCTITTQTFFKQRAFKHLRELSVLDDNTRNC